MIKTSVKKRILLYLCILLVVIFFVYQIVIWMLNGVITTEATISYTVFDDITADAVFIRNEKLIEKSADGVYSYAVSNGEKVSSGGVIASIYGDSASAENQIKLNKLKNQRDELISLQNTGTSYFADIDLINAKVDADILYLLDIIYDSKGLDSLTEYSADLLYQLNKKQISTGYISNFNDLITKLDTEILNIESSLNPPVSSVFSPVSGYFVNKVDGYENNLSFDDLNNFSVSEYDTIDAIQPVDTAGYVGKVIIGDKWNAVCVVETSKAALINVGQEVKINIPQISVSDISADVVAINPDSSGEKSLIVIECDEISDNIVNLRFESISIHANHYSGLRISTDAIRVVDGVTGVYVIQENEARFKKIDIIFSSVDFVICKIEDKNNALILYDEVITEGSNLYDGKVIK